MKKKFSRLETRPFREKEKPQTDEELRKESERLDKELEELQEETRRLWKEVTSIDLNAKREWRPELAKINPFDSTKLDESSAKTEKAIQEFNEGMWELLDEIERCGITLDEKTLKSLEYLYEDN